jgi:hypothetical protein
MIKEVGQQYLASSLRRLNPEPRQFHPPAERGDPGVLEHDERLTPVVLAEYSAIRQEIQTALSNQQSTLSLGAATLGLLGAVGARFWPSDLTLAGLVFALTVPAACGVAVRMWYGELLRIARGARFVAGIEDWVNSRAPARVLYWEHWMDECRRRPGHDFDRANWRAVQFVFGALSVMSMALGLYWLWMAGGPSLALVIGLVDAAMCAHACHRIAQLGERAKEYLKLDAGQAWGASRLTLADVGEAAHAEARAGGVP